jgi:hypothetical protein
MRGLRPFPERCARAENPSSLPRHCARSELSFDSIADISRGDARFVPGRKLAKAPLPIRRRRHHPMQWRSLVARSRRHIVFRHRQWFFSSTGNWLGRYRIINHKTIINPNGIITAKFSGPSTVKGGRRGLHEIACLCGWPCAGSPHCSFCVLRRSGEPSEARSFLASPKTKDLR